VANNCENIHVRFSTFFFILENVGKIKNVKNVKKRFLTSMALTIALPGHTMMDGAIEDTCQMTSVMTGARD